MKPNVTRGEEPAAVPESVTDEVPHTDAEPPATELIPGWLALLVLVLLLAVAGLGGYLIWGVLADRGAATPIDQAVQDWEARAAESPDDPETLLSLGYAYQQAGRYADAIDRYDDVLEVDADNVGALYNKGVSLTALDKPKEAEIVFWDLLEVAPDHALAAKALGDYYIGKKQYKSALAALEPVIQARPEYADLQYLAGYACEELDLDERAADYYRSALTYNPDYPKAREGLDRLGVAE